MLKNKKFWFYEVSQNYELKQELLDNYKPKGRFYEDVSFFYEVIGIGPHSSIRNTHGKDHQDPNIINFTNILVDINTIKILFNALPNCKVVTLKFSSNNFEINNLEYLLNSIVNKPSNIYNLIFE